MALALPPCGTHVHQLVKEITNMKHCLTWAVAASVFAVAGAAVEGAFSAEGTTTPSAIARAAESGAADGALPNTSSSAWRVDPLRPANEPRCRAAS
jgi:hypothetical protein